MAYYDEMWQTLQRYRFKLDTQMQLHATCVMCHNLLIDAFQGPCGCNYCKKCLENPIQDGELICPGNSELCSTEKLTTQTNVTKDNSINRRISKFELECPSEGCFHRCQLIDMSDHLRLCYKRSAPCPFREMGCSVAIDLHNTSVSDHLIAEIHIHSKMMVDWIMQIRNEMKSLKISVNDGITEKQLLLLGESLNWKIAQSLVSNKVIQSIRGTGFENIETDVIQPVIENKRRAKFVSESKTYNEQKILFFQSEIKKQAEEIRQLKCRIKTYSNEAAENSLIDLSGNSYGEYTIKDDKINLPTTKSIQIVSFVWDLNEVMSKIKTRGFVSKYVHSTEANLKIYMIHQFCKESNDSKSRVAIQFLNDDHPDQSIKSLIAVTIKNKMKPSSCRTLSKCCMSNGDWSEAILFQFLVSDLYRAGVFDSSWISIECTLKMYE